MSSELSLASEIIVRRFRGRSSTARKGYARTRAWGRVVVLLGAVRIAVTGATGNIGVQVVRALARRPDVDEVVGIARRRPFLDLAGITWREADVSVHDLVPLFRGCAAVIHL